MMMVMLMGTMMVNVCDDDCYLVMKFIFVKEVMSCDVSPVAMFYDYPQKCLPQNCLLVGKSEVGISKLTHHQKCLPQLYYYIFKRECLAALACDWVMVRNCFQQHQTNQESPSNDIKVFRQDISSTQC